MELATPKCRLQLENGTVLWEVNELPKFWTAQKSETCTFNGSDYEVKDATFSFDVEEGAEDPVTGEASPDKLTAVQIVTVKLK